MFNPNWGVVPKDFAKFIVVSAVMLRLSLKILYYEIYMMTIIDEEIKPDDMRLRPGIT